MHAQDYFILSEMEAREAQHKEADMGWQTSMRLSSLASNQFSRPGSERRATMDSHMSESLLGSDHPQVRPFVLLTPGLQWIISYQAVSSSPAVHAAAMMGLCGCAGHLREHK